MRPVELCVFLVAAMASFVKANTFPAGTHPLSANIRSKHTECFVYFAEKDGCVWGAADESLRCKQHKPHEVPLGSGVLLSKPDSSTDSVNPQYDTETGTSKILPGRGICGEYLPNAPGVCLWGGSAQYTGISGSGWISPNDKQNCNKQLWIQRADGTKTAYANVIDDCKFPVNPKTTFPGCVQIGITKAIFDQLATTPEEKNSGVIQNLKWDFNNPRGDKDQWAAS